MVRIFNAVLLTVMIVGAVVTYNMKHRAEIESDKVVKLNSDIAREKEAMSMLRAEWSKLTQPGRLQELAAKYADHFKLEPFAASQFATLEEIPAKPLDGGGALTKKIAEAIQ